MSEQNGVAHPRPAATVILLRPLADGADTAAPRETGAVRAEQGVEALFMRRVPSMGFAPGAFVFPGGSVDERDADGDLPWTGPAPQEWADTLGTDVRLARSLVCAAVRETFEETGVLLASAPEHAGEQAITLDTTSREWERDRLGLIDRSRSFTEVLERRGLVLRSEWLRAWSRWITPRGQPRRYDTWFFAAELPPGQQPRDVGGETDLSQWLAPSAAYSEWEADRMPMLAPTVFTCAELAEHGTLRGLREAVRDIVPIELDVRIIGGEVRIVAPDGTDYPVPSADASP